MVRTFPFRHNDQIRWISPDGYDQSMTDPRSKNEDNQLPLEHAGEGTTADDEVEDASADSFPASDPPSFTSTTATRDAESDSERDDAH